MKIPENLQNSSCLRLKVALYQCLLDEKLCITTNIPRIFYAGQMASRCCTNLLLQNRNCDFWTADDPDSYFFSNESWWSSRKKLKRQTFPNRRASILDNLLATLIY
jgi:hypothetical protein